MPEKFQMGLSTATARGSYFGLIITVTCTTVIFALGLMVSMAVPIALLHYVATTLARKWWALSENQSDAIRDFGNFVIAIGIPLTAGIYDSFFVYFWMEFESLLETVVRSTISMIAASFGIGFCLAIVIALERIIDWKS